MPHTQCVMLQDGHTALMFAAAGGHTDVVKVLLSRQDVGTNMTDKVSYYGVNFSPGVNGYNKDYG